MSRTTSPVTGTGAAAVAQASPAPTPTFDFPGWWPPMLVKELRQGLRQRGFVGGLIAAQAVLVIVFITGFVSDVGNGSSRGMIDGIFWSTLFATLLLIAPLRALGALSAEMEARTMDLLLLTRLDAWRIVWGKWVSLMAQSLLLVTALLPYAVVRYFFGSVDLVEDLTIIAVMLAGSAIFTAAGLWASGMNRVLRLLVVIGAILVSFAMLGNIMSRHAFFGGGLGIGHSSGTAPLFFVIGCWVWIGGCLLVYCLMMAVRWFAPLAENHAIGPRLMPLALAMPIPVMAALTPGVDLREVGASWVCALGVIAAIELACTRELMAIHLRGRLGRRGVRRLIGPALLPGWPSAALWAGALLALVVAVCGLIDLTGLKNLTMPTIAWLAVLAWTGLVFPALLVSLVPSASRVSGVMYFLLHALLGVFAMMAGSSSLSSKAPALMQVLDWVSHAVPTTSFWHALNEANSPSDLPAVAFGQAVGVAVTLALMLPLAKPYWMNVRLMRETMARNAARG